MRIRSTKPEFWRSKTIARLEWSTRLVLKGLESYVDDNGVGKNDIALIAADVFPRDLSGNPPETLRKLTEAISELDSAGLIVRYEINGEELLYIDKWRDIQYVQKPKAGRYRRPDGTLEYHEAVDQDSYRKAPEVVRKSPEVVQPVSGEQGNRGTGGKDPPYPPAAEPSPNPAAPSRNGGAKTALDRMRETNLTARSLDAYRIAEAFSASSAVPIEGGLLSGIGVQIDKCLKRGIPPPAIAAGLQAWTASDSWSPTQIPNFVHKANNRGQPTNGKPTTKALGYDDALAELLQEVTTL